jgi:hypothetical protein
MTETPFGGESQSRLFIIIAIGLVGLLVLGLMGIGGYVIFSRYRRGAEEVAVAQTAAAATAEVQATAEAPTEPPVPTFTPMPTPTVAATNTPVVPLITGTPEETRPAPTPVRTATPRPAQGETPSAGFGGIGAILAGLALAVVLVVVRKVRLAG